MRKVLIALALLAAAARPSAAQVDRFLPDQNVIRSSVTIVVVLVSSYTPTLVDTAQMEGSFAAEVQNRDASNGVCCAFDAAFSTVTASAQGKGCRQIAANGGTWSVQRWWQNLRLYCQSFSTTGTSAVAVTQGK